MDFINKSADASEPAHEVVKIKVIGVGGGGCNAVDRLKAANVEGVEFIACNTDMTSLNSVLADKKIQLGSKLTHGLGAGSKPSVGEQAANESREEIKEALEGANLVFVTAGMGGGTGTGGAPVVASIAKELGILTIALVTKPFDYEGRPKMIVAEEGIEKLSKEADVLIVIPNEKAFSFLPANTPMIKVVQIPDGVLHNSIIGIIDIVAKPALINLDFADLETVIKNKGTAHIGVGRAKGETRVMEALRQAASSSLLESNIEGATQLIVSVTGDVNISGNDIKKALEAISNIVAPEANIIHGLGLINSMKDEAIVTVIATGFDAKKADPENNLADKLIFNTPGQDDRNEKPEYTGDYILSGYKKQETPLQVEKPAPQQPKASDEYPSFIKRLLEKAGK